MPLNSDGIWVVKLWLAAVVLSGVVFGPLTPTARAASTSLQINPATTTVNPGDSFRVDIVLNTDLPSRGVQFGLKFDPSLVQVDKVQNGPFFASWATANSAQTANPVPFRPNNNRGEVAPGAVVVIGGPPTAGATGSGTVVTLQMTARPGATGRATLDFNTVVVSSARAETIPGVVGTGGLILVGVPDDGSAPRSAVLVDTSAPPPDVVPTGPGSTTQGLPTPPPPVALVPTLNPAALAQAAAQPVEIAPPAAQVPTAPVVAAPPEPALTPVPQPTPAPPAAAPAPAPAEIVQLAPTPQPAEASQPGTEQQTSAVPPATPPASQINAPQVNLLATMAVLATAQAASPTTPTPGNGAAVVPAVGTPRPVGAPAVAGAQALALGSPVARPQAAAPIARPTASPGVFIPWEVVAGIGGGLVSAALVLYAFRRPNAGQS